MKKLDLLPTDENVYDALINNSIGRNEDVFSLVNFLNFIEEGCSIAIDGSWGSGKTFFVKQAKMILDSLNDSNPYSQTEFGKHVKDTWLNTKTPNIVSNKSFITTYYDAWEHDDEDDPLLSLVYEIMQENLYSINIENQKDWIDIIAKVSDLVTSKNISGIINALKGKSIFKKNQSNAELKEIINTYLDSLVQASGSTLIIFIDELDRCSPAYAIKLLERVKHYLQKESIIFIFSINQIELQKTIRTYYGYDFDASRYLNRFFDFRFTIPEINIQAYVNSLGLFPINNLRELTCIEFINQTNMSLRDITKFINTSVNAAYSATDSSNARELLSAQYDGGRIMELMYSVIVPIAIGLRIINMDEYDEFINGRNYKWLIEIMFSNRLIDYTLSYFGEKRPKSKETIDEMIEKVKTIIQQIYYSIFNPNYLTRASYRVANYNIDFTAKKNILAAVNLASKYTKLIDE